MTQVAPTDPSARIVALAMKAPRLTREKEHELVVAWKRDRDSRAADRLARSHLRSVVFQALKYKGYGTPLSELIAAGNLGLAHALGKFDPGRGTRFATYADHWIRAYMVRHMIRTRSMVTGGYGALESRLFFKLRRASGRIQAMTGDQDEALDALAASMEVPRSRLDEMLRRVQDRDVALDQPVREDSETSRLEMLVSDAVAQDEALRVAEAHDKVKRVVQAAVGTLTPRERLIVEHRLLAEPEERLTLEDLGAELGVSRERVRQLENEIKQKLQRRLSKPWRESLQALITPV
jgi:RNA polymerase sigma-32 factor